MDIDRNKFYFNTLRCVSAFVDHNRQPKFRVFTFIAHNPSGFDNYILLEYFVKWVLGSPHMCSGKKKGEADMSLQKPQLESCGAWHHKSDDSRLGVNLSAAQTEYRHWL